MYQYNPYDFQDQNHSRIRQMKSMLEQLKADHAELKNLWEKFENDRFEMSGIDDIVRVLSWIQTGITALKKLSKNGLEGVTWGGVRDIEDDIRNKEVYLKTFCFKRRGINISSEGKAPRP